MPSTSASLLDGLRVLDPQAWRNLTEVYGPDVFGYARRRGLQSSDANDATQEVFAAVLAGIQQFRKELPGHSFRRWLFAITRNVVAEYYRRLYQEPRVIGGSAVQEQLKQLADAPTDSAPESTREVGDEEDVPDSFAERSVIVRRAWQLIQSEFNPKHLEVCRLRASGMPSPEVARQLNLSVDVVYQAFSRVRRRLKEYLDGLD